MPFFPLCSGSFCHFCTTTMAQLWITISLFSAHGKIRKQKKVFYYAQETPPSGSTDALLTFVVNTTKPRGSCENSNDKCQLLEVSICSIFSCAEKKPRHPL